MDTQQMLLVKANEAIAALWMHQLKKISDATGVGMDVLCNAIQGDFVPLQVAAAAVPEKKKKGGKAPLEPPSAEIATATAVPEKKKKGGKAPLEPPSAEIAAATAVPEKKKRAPPKKKELVVVPDDASVAVSEVSAAVSNASSEKKAKNDAEALEKKAKKDAEALEKKLKKEMEAIEKKAKKDAEAIAKAAKKEADALEKAAKKAEKKPPAKKAKAAVAAKEEEKKPELVARFNTGEQVRYLRPTGKTVDAVVEYVIKYDDYVEYKLQVVGKNETILSREETTFALGQIPNEPEDESDDEDDADTVMMPETPAGSPAKGNKRPDVFLKNTRINVERVNINGTSYLIGENDIAFLESSKKMVGKYDQTDHSIRQLYPAEYDEYYGANSDGEASDEDECPDMSDMSGSDSDSGSESE